MARRKREIPSSLELFLDTICNTFGGIVFLAILLSVIVQDRSKKSESTEQQGSITVEEAQRLAMRSERLNDRFSQLTLVIKDLENLQPTGDDNRLDEVSIKLQQSQKSLAAELLQQKELASQINSQASKNADLAKSQAEVKEYAESEKQKLANEKSRLKNQLDERTQTLNLPRVESVAKQSVILLMRFGKVYRLFIEGTTADKSQLRVVSDNVRKLEVEPKKDEGWQLGQVTHRVLLSQYLTSFPPSSYAARLYVWPDSFEQFAELKRLLLEQRFQYELEPYSDGDTITFVQGGHSPMVQ